MTISNSIVLADNAYGTIASGLAVGDTALAFTSGHGARFPTVAAGQALYCCILNTSNILEEVIITAHSAGSDSATITRAAGNTSAKAWTAGDRIEARPSSEMLKRVAQEALLETLITTTDAGQSYLGTMSPAALGLISGKVYPLTLTVTNTGTAPAVNLNGLGAVTVKGDGGSALSPGFMPLKGLYGFDGTDFILMNPKAAQGTWTPSDQSGDGLSFSGVSATYEKIGRQVTCRATLSYPVTAGTNSARIGGLPFAPANVNSAIAVLNYCNLPAAQNALFSASNIGITDATKNFVTNAVLSGGLLELLISYHAG